jgi:hypothetical protein
MGMALKYQYSSAIPWSSYPRWLHETMLGRRNRQTLRLNARGAHVMNRKWSFSLLAWLAFSGPITYAAVITETRHVSVDAATSQASYHTTDWIFESDGQGGFLGRTIETMVESRIAGSFDRSVKSAAP